MAFLAPQTPVSPTSRPTSSYSGFHLPSSSSSDSGTSDTDAALPFPAALARKDFLAPDFHAAAYLSSLFPSDADTTSAHRHQTLEDLRGDLRERSSAISAELLELVNANYTSFLELGNELKGGEERVEDVRVALLGFRRAIGDVQSRVQSRRMEVAGVCKELDGVRREIELGRRMLELDDRVTLLEGKLAVENSSKNGKSIQNEDGVEMDGSDEDEDDERGGNRFPGSSPGKLLGLAKALIGADLLATSIGKDIPYVKKMDERLLRCRSTLFLDLNTALKVARSAGPEARGSVLDLLSIYRTLGGDAEAVRALS
jgi:conserved oligomeric Golgi complex subunit 2